MRLSKEPSYWPPHTPVAEDQHWWSERNEADKLPRYGRVTTTKEPVGWVFGGYTLLSRDMLWVRTNPRVLVQCTGCLSIYWRPYRQVKVNTTQRCRNCNQARDWPRWLLLRCAGEQKRCTHPGHPQYKDYGGRGIEFRFAGPAEAASWVWENLGVDRDRDLDRIDNDGHYEPGNLRWATKSQNSRNRRCSLLPEGYEFREEEWPYAQPTVEDLLRSGLTRQDILDRAARGTQPGTQVPQWTDLLHRLHTLQYRCGDRVPEFPVDLCWCKL